MTAPVITNIQATRGDSFTRTLTFTEELSAFQSIWFTVRETWATNETDDEEAVSQATLGDGIEAGVEDNEAVVSFAATATRDWQFDSYVYDVQVLTTGGKTHTALRGFLRIMPDVTRST